MQVHRNQRKSMHVVRRVMLRKLKTGGILLFIKSYI